MNPEETTRFINIWNSSTSARSAAVKLSLPRDTARSTAARLRTRGYYLVNFRGPYKKRSGDMSAPNKKLVQVMAATGYLECKVLAQELGCSASHVMNLSKRTGKTVECARFKFVHADSVREAHAKRKEKRAAASNQGGSHRPRLNHDFWQTLRAVVREEITAALSHYEVVVQRVVDEEQG